MSAIASFYLIPATKTDEFFESAMPKRTEIKKKVLSFSRTEIVEEDHMWSFLSAEAEQLEEFACSGYAFADLLLILEDKVKRCIFGGFRNDECNEVCVARNVSLCLFDQAAAQEALSDLRAASLTESDIRRFLLSDQGETDPETVEAVKTAYRQEQAWLSKVTDDTIGLLVIG